MGLMGRGRIVCQLVEEGGEVAVGGVAYKMCDTPNVFECRSWLGVKLKIFLLMGR